MGRGTQQRAAARTAARARGPVRIPVLLRRHPTLSAAALFALLVLAYLWPVLLGGKLLSVDATLYDLTPWDVFRPANAASFRNVLLGDVPLVVRPWHMLVRELLHDGVLPLWNPHVLTGIPIFQNPQTGLFTPFSLPLWILPFDYAGVGVTAAFKSESQHWKNLPARAQLKVGFLAGIAAGASFAFCSMNVTWLLPEAVPAVVVWLAVDDLARRAAARARRDRHRDRDRVRDHGRTQRGGHPGSQAHVLVAAGLYALLRAGLSRERAPPERLRGVAFALGGLALGIGSREQC